MTEHNNKKYICAVGDSFVYGSELVATHNPDLIATLSKQDLYSIEYGVNYHLTPVTDSMRMQYDTLLNTMRFSSIVANELSIGHINYALGGASQEGIKLQTYLLLNHLRANNIDPADTTWLVGITMPTRKMMLEEPFKWTIENEIRNTSDPNWVLSRKTFRTFFGDKLTQSIPFSEAFIKGTIAETTVTQTYVSWLMHVLDTFYLLKSNNVKNILMLNLFLHMDFTTFEQADDVTEAVRSILKTMAEPMLDSIHPTPYRSFIDYLFNDPSWGQCKDGHPDRAGHKLIAEHLLSRI